jgi:hypothetical protein
MWAETGGGAADSVKVGRLPEGDSFKYYYDMGDRSEFAVFVGASEEVGGGMMGRQGGRVGWKDVRS